MKKLTVIFTLLFSQLAFSSIMDGTIDCISDNISTELELDSSKKAFAKQFAILNIFSNDDFRNELDRDGFQNEEEINQMLQGLKDYEKQVNSTAKLSKSEKSTLILIAKECIEINKKD